MLLDQRGTASLRSLSDAPGAMNSSSARNTICVGDIIDIAAKIGRDLNLLPARRREGRAPADIGGGALAVRACAPGQGAGVALRIGISQAPLLADIGPADTVGSAVGVVLWAAFSRRSWAANPPTTTYEAP